MAIGLEELLKLPPSEMPRHNEKPTAEELRSKQQTYYEDVHEGTELPRYIYQPTPTHLFRWSAAIENWHRIHYDLDFATNHDKLPGVLVQGSWKQSVVPPVPQGLDPAGWMALEGFVRAPGHARAGGHPYFVGYSHRQV